MRSRFEAVETRVFAGHAVDLDDLDARLVVELWVDGWPARLGRAHQFVETLFDEGLGDACYGFRFVLDDPTLKAGALVEVRLANTGELLGEPLRVGPKVDWAARQAEARWLGQLLITGWVGSPESGAIPTVRALVDGQPVAEARADRWTYLSDGSEGAPARAFDLNLPPHMADGRMRRVRIVDEQGRDLPGSPIAVLAFADGLARFCADHAEIEAEEPRGAVFDEMFTRAHPFHDYRAWARRFPAPAPVLAHRPRAAVAIVGVADPEATLASLETQEGCDWVAAALHGSDPTGFEAADLAAFLAEEALDAEFVVFAPAGAVFTPRALARYAEAFQANPGACIVYGDLSIRSESGEDWPVAFPAFDYERMLEQGYAAFGCAASRVHLEAAAAAGASDIYSLVLLAVEATDNLRLGSIVHAPGVLWRAPQFDLDAASEGLRRAVEAHLAARKVPATFEALFAGRFPAIRVNRKPAVGRVSVIVTTRDSTESLEAFLDAFEATTSEVETDLIVVDLDSASEAALELLAEMDSDRLRVARIVGPPQPERAYNSAAHVATGAFLLFCDDDMRPVRSGWLSEMLGRLAEPHVGAVAPTLLWPTGTVQQCGLAVGPDFSASRAFRDLADGDLGYAETMAVAHEVGAISTAGLLTRRVDFLNLGGFDVQRFGLAWSSVDYSLKLRAAGFRIVATPHAKLRRTRLNREPSPHSDVGDRARRELEALRYVWGDTLQNDPAYSPLLTHAGAPFSALAWPPRDLTPRTTTVKKPKAWPDGL